MKISTTLSKGLSQEQLEQLERELKNSLVVKRIREVLKDRIEQSLVSEEFFEDQDLGTIAHTFGKRRGFREILNLLPEE